MFDDCWNLNLPSCMSALPCWRSYTLVIVTGNRWLHLAGWLLSCRGSVAAAYVVDCTQIFRNESGSLYHSIFEGTFSVWGQIKHGVLQGSIPGPLFFLTYINDLSNIIAKPSKPFLFADGTSKIITNPSPSKFKEDINNIIDNINDWFKGNSLSLNFDETYFLQIRPKIGIKLIKKEVVTNWLKRLKILHFLD